MARQMRLTVEEYINRSLHSDNIDLLIEDILALNDAEFVKAAYLLFFRRFPEEHEITQVLSRLHGGTDKKALLFELSESSLIPQDFPRPYWIKEFARLCGPDGAFSVSPDVPLGDILEGKYDHPTTVQFTYQHVLDREADREGLEYWTQRLKHGTDVVYVVWSIATSSEGLARKRVSEADMYDLANRLFQSTGFRSLLSMSTLSLIELCYRAFERRVPSTAEREGWLAARDRGWSNGDILWALARAMQGVSRVSPRANKGARSLHDWFCFFKWFVLQKSRVARFRTLLKGVSVGLVRLQQIEKQNDHLGHRLGIFRNEMGKIIENRTREVTEEIGRQISADFLDRISEELQGVRRQLLETREDQTREVTERLSRQIRMDFVRQISGELRGVRTQLQETVENQAREVTENLDRQIRKDFLGAISDEVQDVRRQLHKVVENKTRQIIEDLGRQIRTDLLSKISGEVESVRDLLQEMVDKQTRQITERLDTQIRRDFLDALSEELQDVRTQVRESVENQGREVTGEIGRQIRTDFLGAISEELQGVRTQLRETVEDQAREVTEGLGKQIRTDLLGGVSAELQDVRIQIQDAVEHRTSEVTEDLGRQLRMDLLEPLSAELRGARTQVQETMENQTREVAERLARQIPADLLGTLSGELQGARSRMVTVESVLQEIRGNVSLEKKFVPTTHDIMLASHPLGLLMGLPAEEWALLACYFLGEGFERGTTKVLDTIVKEGMVVVDVGAHVGLHTITMGYRVGPSGRVHCFEPTPRAHEILSMNVFMNQVVNPQMCANIVLHQSAVADYCGKGPFHVVVGNTGWSTMYQPPEVAKNTQPLEVDVTTLDHALKKEQRVDLIKIDAEGAERAIFSGLSNILRKNPHIKIIMEFGPGNLSRAGVDPGEFVDYLHSLQFRIQAIDETERTLRDVSREALVNCWSVNVLLSRNHEAM